MPKKYRRCTKKSFVHEFLTDGLNSIKVRASSKNLWSINSDDMRQLGLVLRAYANSTTARGLQEGNN